MPYRKLTPRQVRWARRWMTLVIIGLFIFILGVEPDMIGMDRSPVVGFVQIGVWLSGLALLLVSAYATVRVIRNSRPTSLRADIGVRLIGTGYVVAAAASLADFIGIGAQHMPAVSFGPLQVVGLIVGVLLSLVGMVAGLIRLFLGETAVDRLVALDLLTVISISLIVIVAHYADRFIYIDVAIVYGLLSFLGVLGVARYLEKGL